MVDGGNLETCILATAFKPSKLACPHRFQIAQSGPDEKQCRHTCQDEEDAVRPQGGTRDIGNRQTWAATSGHGEVQKPNTGLLHECTSACLGSGGYA
eukprot:685906-Rhodomonas_salina.5